MAFIVIKTSPDGPNYKRGDIIDRRRSDTKTGLPMAGGAEVVSEGFLIVEVTDLSWIEAEAYCQPLQNQVQVMTPLGGVVDSVETVHARLYYINPDQFNLEAIEASDDWTIPQITADMIQRKDD